MKTFKIKNKVRIGRLRWFGHVQHMDERKMPKYCSWGIRRKTLEKQKKTGNWKNMINETLKSCGWNRKTCKARWKTMTFVLPNVLPAHGRTEQAKMSNMCRVMLRIVFPFCAKF